MGWSESPRKTGNALVCAIMAKPELSSSARPNQPAGPAALPAIPVIDLGRAATPALLEAEPARARALLAAGRRYLPGGVARLADRISAQWLLASGSPYLGEIEAMAAHLGAPGVLFLNASYEWACTSAVERASGAPGQRLVRTLDWPLPGLGRHLVAARHTGPAGPWVNLTWPGFAGAIQGLAPGRFAAAINQAPMRRHGLGLIPDWALNRWRVWRRPALPPSHLLRRVFETCADYAAARRLLCETPIAMPTIFALCGPGAGEACVIEREETSSAILDGPVAAANHWQKIARRDRARGEDSDGRLALMTRRLGDPLDVPLGDPGGGLRAEPRADGAFAWLTPPILNPMTRVALVAEPASGALAVRGYEAEGPVTDSLHLGPGLDPGPGPGPGAGRA